MNSQEEFPDEEARLQAVRQACWDAELVWLATGGGQAFLALEPSAERDGPVAQSLGLTLAGHLEHPEYAWREVYRNLSEES
jgi:hypothetical protein